MSTTIELDPPACSDSTVVAGQGGHRLALIRRIWNLPIWTHAAVLAVVLLSALPIIGTRSSSSPTKAPRSIQARQLSRGDGWITPYVFTRIDPAMIGYPLAVADAGRDGRAAYA